MNGRRRGIDYSRGRLYSLRKEIDEKSSIKNWRLFEEQARKLSELYKLNCNT